MKISLLTLLATASLLSADPAEDYLNFILQIQNNEDQTTHKIDDIDPQGSRNALQGIYGSSVFQLWTIHKESGAEYLLDEKTVSSYHPQAEIKITSLDPYSVTPRIRVGEEFTVSYTISGLRPDETDAQEAAKSVIFDQSVISFGDGEREHTSTAHVSSTQTELHKNGSDISQWTSSVIGEDVRFVAGEEEFTIYAKPDYGVEDATMLARAKVQVWPMATATISGSDQNEVYKTLPPIKISLKDLYPDSNTFLIYYKGPHSVHPSNIKLINTANVTISDVKPQNREFTIGNLNDFITEDGIYTVEIFHKTPFELNNDAVPLGSATMTLKKSIEFNGQLNSAE